MDKILVTVTIQPSKFRQVSGPWFPQLENGNETSNLTQITALIH